MKSHRMLVLLIVITVLVSLLPIQVASAQASGPTGPYIVIRHTVRPNDTWGTIANKYGSTVQLLTTLNGSGSLIVGRTVKVAVRAAVPGGANIRGSNYHGYPRNYDPHKWR